MRFFMCFAFLFHTHSWREGRMLFHTGNLFIGLLTDAPPPSSFFTQRLKEIYILRGSECEDMRKVLLFLPLDFIAKPTPIAQQKPFF